MYYKKILEEDCLWKSKKIKNMNEKKPIRLTEHAELKIEILKSHGFKVSEGVIKNTIYDADRVESTYKGRKVAQKVISENHVFESNI
jgi:hypothetical protein